MRAFCGNEMKRSGVSARSNLAENAQTQTELTFHDEVHEVVRHDRVVSGRRIHLGRRESFPIDRNRVAAFARSTELDFHVMTLLAMNLCENSTSENRRT